MAELEAEENEELLCPETETETHVWGKGNSQNLPKPAASIQGFALPQAVMIRLSAALKEY